MVKVIREKTDAGPWLSVVETAGGGGTPGGSDTEVQYNDGGAFGGATGFTFDDATGAVTISPSEDASALTLSGDSDQLSDVLRIELPADPSENYPYAIHVIAPDGVTDRLTTDGYGDFTLNMSDPGAARMQVLSDNQPMLSMEASTLAITTGVDTLLGFFGHTPAAQPEVDALATGQSIVDALVALGLVTQAS